jgi:methionyl-tRNA formyltransferase
MCRLEACQDVEYLGGFFQAAGTGYAAVAKDLWRRRRLVAVPLLVARLFKQIVERLSSSPGDAACNQVLARLRPRTWFVRDIHAAEVLRQVRSLEADLGLVYGSPILKPALFTIPPLGTLGIHHGKLPQYRGKKTTFWAMYNGEPTVGVAIQRIGAGLDTGAIARQGEVPVDGRSERAVWNDLESLGLDLYLAAILDVKRGQAVYTPQPRVAGRLYRDPKLADLLRFRWQQANKRLRQRNLESAS